MRPQKYPIGIQTFSDIIEEKYLYVDKTELIYSLVTRGKYYFLSRPRRFGKSLLLSTIEALFQGRRELFEGLYIADKEWDWSPHPVFHLALNNQYYNSVEDLEENLHNILGRIEDEYHLPKGDSQQSPSIRFTDAISNAVTKTGRKVVILIDEYDQPLLQNIEEGKEDLHNALRVRLQAFYSVMKAMDKYIRFAMLSGISKFSKVSVFSGLNNLEDISLIEHFNSICGIAESELPRYFQQSIEELAKSYGSSLEETKAILKREYDGYRFAWRGENIYNPFSLLTTFKNRRYGRYWFASGTPSFIISLLKRRHWNLQQIEGSTCSQSELMGADRYLTNPIPLLYQSGYLTIKGYDEEFDEYTMGYPNEEVAEGFAYDLLRRYSENDSSGSVIKKFVRDVREGRAEEFMKALQSFSADIPYDQIVDRELHFQNLMYIIMKLMGFHVHTEYQTSDGRIDMTVMTDRFVYVIEFKFHGTADDAMTQIHDKQYRLPFLKDEKEIVLIGAAFSKEKRRLETWRIERGR